MRLYDECVNVRSVAEVVGDCQATPAPSKGPRLPFSRKLLSQSAENQEQEQEQEQGDEGEEVEEVEAEVDTDCAEDDDEDVAEVVPDDAPLQWSSRSGRACKRPNHYIREPAQPQQLSKRPKAVVGKPVVAVAVNRVAAAAAAAASGGPSDAPIPTYDDAEEMRSLKEIRKRIAHLL